MRASGFVFLVMTLLLKTDFSDASVAPTDDQQWDKLVLPSGEIPIMYEAGTPEDRRASIVDNSLQFETRNATIPGDRLGYRKGRVQLNYSLLDVESVTMRTRVLLDNEAYRSYPKSNTWFTIAELWAGAASSKYPFRISVNLMKDFGVGMPVFLSVTGSQRMYGRWWPIWSMANREDRPALGGWFDLELSCRMGNFLTGNVTLSMDGGKLFNSTNWTYHRKSPAPVPFTMIQPCKLYTSGSVIDHMRETGQPARILWDGLEIWK